MKKTIALWCMVAVVLVHDAIACRPAVTGAVDVAAAVSCVDNAKAEGLNDAQAADRCQLPNERAVSDLDTAVHVFALHHADAGPK